MLRVVTRTTLRKYLVPMIAIGTLFPGRSLLDCPETDFDAPDRSHAPGLFLLRSRLAQRPRVRFVKRSRHCRNHRPPKSFQTLSMSAVISVLGRHNLARDTSETPSGAACHAAFVRLKSMPLQLSERLLTSQPAFFFFLPIAGIGVPAFAAG